MEGVAYFRRQLSTGRLKQIAFKRNNLTLRFYINSLLYYFLLTKNIYDLITLSWYLFSKRFYKWTLLLFKVIYKLKYTVLQNNFIFRLLSNNWIEFWGFRLIFTKFTIVNTHANYSRSFMILYLIKNKYYLIFT